MRIILRLLGTARELWPLYLGIVVAAVLIALTALLTPFIIKAATDEVVGATTGSGGSVRTVLWLAVALLAADLANTLVTNVGGYLGDLMAARLRQILSTRYYAHLLRLPQRYFDEQLTGTIISRLHRSIIETTSFLNMFANSFFPMIITLGAVLVITAYYAWPLTLMLVVVVPTFTWLTALTSTRWQRLEGEKNREVDAAGGRFAEVIGQIRVVKSFAREREELAQFADRYRRTVAVTRVQSRWWHLMDIARRSALNVIFFGIFAVIFVRTAQGAFTIGVMVLLIQLVNMARQPVQMMSMVVDSTQHAIAGSRDYLAVLDETPDRDLEVGAPAVIAGTGAVAARAETAPTSLVVPGDTSTPAVEFDHASFGYEGGAEVVSDVSFSIAPGERVAFVGESGGGKTTLVNLLLGLYPLGSGHVRLFGHDVADLPLGQLRRSIGVVFQEASLFSGTLRENVLYGRPQATEEEMIAAAQRAHAHEFISRFDDGYDALIGERGLKLSGGQKQRIAIARALLKDAPVLVLDEATSALDSKSERWVQAGLEQLMEGRTSLIIAHRLSTISGVDRIITLRDGRVDEIGTPDELAQTGGIYAELLALQHSASARDRKRLREFDIAG